MLPRSRFDGGMENRMPIRKVTGGGVGRDKNLYGGQNNAVSVFYWREKETKEH